MGRRSAAGPFFQGTVITQVITNSVKLLSTGIQSLGDKHYYSQDIDGIARQTDKDTDHDTGAMRAKIRFHSPYKGG